MSELRFETIQFPSAELFDANPFIPMNSGDVHQNVRVDDSIPKEDCEFVGKGFKKNCLPYLLQDRYSREIKDRDFRIAILENEFTKATFSLDYGGRLLSLYSKTHDKELLSVNPVWQPANLAIRNAWYSGGVEWNIGLIGHSPHTCSKLFTARVNGPDGMPVLRMYEYERIRQVPYQLDFYLKDDSPFLFVKVKIINPHDDDIFMYWWSNIAVDEGDDVRVLVPANHCYRFGYEGVMMRIETPVDLNTKVDYSYTTKVDRAMDYFFRLPNEERRWITSLGADGKGLIQTSTDLLKGRKLFVWGKSIGGNNWQKFLSNGQREYLEIQAGLGLTQTEHIRMPPGEWSWLEAYGLLDADSEMVHGSDWQTATGHVTDTLQQALPREELDNEHERAKAIANLEIAEVIQDGSGWGALEVTYRNKHNDKNMCQASMQFTNASLGPDQQAWLDLLEHNTYTHAGTTPAAPITEARWMSLLENAEKNYEGWYQLGVMYYAEERYDDATAAWEQSIALQRNPFALRCLAVQEKLGGNFSQALSYYKEANELHSDVALVCEYAKTALQNKDYQLALEITENTDFNAGRVTLHRGQALLGLNEFDQVKALFSDEYDHIITDLREGESGFDKLWLDLHQQQIMQERGLSEETDEIFYEVIERFPIPEKYSFFMSPPRPPSERIDHGINV